MTFWGGLGVGIGIGVGMELVRFLRMVLPERYYRVRVWRLMRAWRRTWELIPEGWRHQCGHLLDVARVSEELGPEAVESFSQHAPLFCTACGGSPDTPHRGPELGKRFGRERGRTTELQKFREHLGPGTPLHSVPRGEDDEYN